jgi:endonuclease/exonuclease/phosphatase family metal-dependent hydrolase
MGTLRLLTINTHKGFSWMNLRFVLHELRRAIRSVKADVVFLQEVVGENVRRAESVTDWPDGPHHEFLAEAFWPHHAYGKNAVYRHGHHGNAILSSHPIVRSEKVDISTNRFEQRGLLCCEMAVEGWQQPLYCVCVHLGLTAHSRRKQLRALRRYIDDTVPADAPVSVAGDFNDWTGVNVRRFAASMGLIDVASMVRRRKRATFPAWRPVLALDRVYVRGLEPVAAEVLHGGVWGKLSDHAALCVDVDVDGICPESIPME